MCLPVSCHSCCPCVIHACCGLQLPFEGLIKCILSQAVSGLDSDEDQEEDRDPHPRSLRVLGWGSDCDPEVDIYMGEEEFWERRGVLTQRDRNYEGDWEEEEEEEEEEEWESSSSPGMFCALREHFPLLRSGVQRTRASWGSEPELTHLREGETDVIHTCAHVDEHLHSVSGTNSIKDLMLRIMPFLLWKHNNKKNID